MRKPQLWVAVALSVAGAAQAESDLGAQIPSGVKKVADHRYQAPSDFASTLKYYRGVYPPENFPRIPIVNQPGVKATHIANPSPKPGGWEGINIYQTDDGCRIYVLRADGKFVGKRNAP